jgi:hypothetical protein
MSGSPPTTTLIDVIVLVFSKSELKSLVGTDALRTVLEGETRALFPESDTIDLQPVWELLESQPGFVPEKAVAPFCRLKTWELRLKKKVVMPGPLASLDQKSCEVKAMNVNAFDSDLDKLLAPPAPKAAPVARVIESGSAKESAAVTASSRRAKLAAVAAFLGLAAAGVSIYLTLGRSSGTTVQIPAKELSEDVPLAHVRKNGDVMIATVTDVGWLAKTEFERRKHLEAVAAKMRTHQVRTLLLVNPRNAIVATVALRGAPVISFIPQAQPSPK